MNYKEISETLPLNLFDIYEIWSKIGDELEQSDTGRVAKKVIDKAGNQIGRILLEAVEGVVANALESIADKVVEEVKEIIEDVTEFVSGAENDTSN